MKIDVSRLLYFIPVVLLMTACGGNSSDNSVFETGDLSSAARVSTLEINDPHCPGGGVLVETGIDENANGLLDDDEVDTFQKVCHGNDGAVGTNGADGMDGTDGVDGWNSLITLVDEPVGINCPNGGTRIDVGLDANTNGLLDGSEITTTEYICAVDVSDEAPELTSDNVFSVKENNATVATITATDPQSDNVIFSVMNSYDGASFTINGATGELSFINLPDYESPLDGDRDNVYQVQIGATDGAYLATQFVSITVTDGLELDVASPVDKSYVNRIWFEWSGYDGASYYRLLVNPDGVSGYSQVGFNIVDTGMATFTSWVEVPVHLTDWLNASYIIEAHGGGQLLATSAPVGIVTAMIEAIGYIKSSNTEAGDVFGSSVALSGDGRTLAVGATGEDSNGEPNFNVESSSGAVYIFKRGSTWIPSGYIKAINAGENDQFGLTVALSHDGNTLAVGAPYEDSNAVGINDHANNGDDFNSSNSGAAYVFAYSNGNWYQQAYVKASNTGKDDWFGFRISLSGDGNILAVGAVKEGSIATGIDGNQADDTAAGAGAVYLFSRSGTTWSQQSYIKASNTGAGDGFGSSVDLSDDGNTLVVGASGEDSAATGIGGNQADDTFSVAGAVYLFTNNGTWSQQAYIKASNTGMGDGFGGDVSLSGDGNTLAVGASAERSNAIGIDGDQDNDLAIYSGAVYIFSYNGIWTQQAYIKASNTESRDYFGGSIALSSDGNILAAGAGLDDSDATGIDGDQGNAGYQTGAAYVFTRSGITWNQKAYIKASNTGRDDKFGRSVTLSGDGEILAVGAYWEGSNATGVNGDQDNDSAEISGAVYIY